MEELTAGNGIKWIDGSTKTVKMTRKDESGETFAMFHELSNEWSLSQLKELGVMGEITKPPTKRMFAFSLPNGPLVGVSALNKPGMFFASAVKVTSDVEPICNDNIAIDYSPELLLAALQKTTEDVVITLIPSSPDSDYNVIRICNRQ